ncbi:MAG: SDR family oxidoreductase [Proteobacteria bacterium]|nr:SDR family oxidoreductase [Pseudomonadota bacterium]
MSDDFRGRTALITGAGKFTGIGYGIAAGMAALGANVVLTDLDRPPEGDSFIKFGSLDEMGRIVERLEADHGIEALALGMDVTRTDSVEAAMAAVRERFGRLDFLFNNAGGAPGAPSPVHEYDETGWLKTFDINVHGVYRVCKAAVPLMKGRASAIVNIASRAGKTPARLNGAYSASKAAVIMVTKVMAQELAEEGIRVNAVCPGLIKTDLQEGNLALKAIVFSTSVEEAENRMTGMVPLGRMGTIDEVADLCAYLVSSRSSYITGQAINIGGGMLMEL